MTILIAGFLFVASPSGFTLEVGKAAVAPGQPGFQAASSGSEKVAKKDAKDAEPPQKGEKADPQAKGSTGAKDAPPVEGGKKASGKEPKGAAAGVDPPAGPGSSGAVDGKGPPPRPTPQFKNPQALEKFQDAAKKLESGDYVNARTAFNNLLKDASTPNDRKIVTGFIDDTKLGQELEASKEMVEKKDERKALVRAEKALKANPTSPLAPLVEKFIRETEELVYLILDDFEPGDALEKETGANQDGTKKKTNDSTRFYEQMSQNNDPRFVRHGKGSMKWRLGGYYGSYYYSSYGGYRSLELKNPITNWRALSFWVYLPEADEGNLRVSLSPTLSVGVVGSLYTKKLIELRGKKGWMEVRVDLNKDFGNTQYVHLEDIRYIRIDSMHIHPRTIYLDFVHLER